MKKHRATTHARPNFGPVDGIHKTIGGGPTGCIDKGVGEALEGFGGITGDGGSAI